MNEVLDFIRSLPPIALLLFFTAVLLLIGYAIWRAVAFSRIKRIIQNLSGDPEKNKELIREKYTSGALLRRSAAIEKQAELLGPQIIPLMGMDEVWAAECVRTKSKKHMLRVMEYAADKGLFSCFLVCVKKRHLFPVFKGGLEEMGMGPFRLYTIARTCTGERFDGRTAYGLCSDRKDELLELAGDTEWNVRYFAVNMLLFADGPRVERILWNAAGDPHPLIREIVVSRFSPAEKEKYYNLLFRAVCDDPVFRVRGEAWRRIHADYPELYRLEPQNLAPDQALHVLELLRPGNKQEENFALGFLDHSNLELRFAAAAYLEKCGVLEKLFLEVDFNDMHVFERNRSLLLKAAEVNVSSFLRSLTGTNNRASLDIASAVLQKNGEVDFISVLARKVFSSYDGTREMEAIYRATVKCVAARGTEEALFFFKYELEKRRLDRKLMSVLLQMVPARAGFILFDVLMSYFLQPFFEPKPELRDAMKGMPHARVLAELLKIIRAAQGVYPPVVRRQAIKLLGELRLHYCLETVLEHLPELPLKEAREYAVEFAGYPAELVTVKVKKLFAKEDNSLRAALVTVIPSLGLAQLQQLVKDSLKDMDPGVRIAAVWALVEIGDAKTLNAGFEILRDPVERVREQAALALGKVGSAATLAKLKDVVMDTDETDAVKQAAIKGLGASASLKSIDLLLTLLEKADAYKDGIIHALSGKMEQDELAALIHSFKEGGPAVRTGIVEVLRQHGSAAEKNMLELLRQDDHSLQPYVAELLESTGFVESTVRRLRHRKPEVRQEAAGVLALIGTPAAYRGIVIAARDPHEAVRIEVVKALERLKSDNGKKVLQTLREDPDKKVRRYTTWALERLKVKQT